jgi:hypothetical protein
VTIVTDRQRSRYRESLFSWLFVVGAGVGSNDWFEPDERALQVEHGLTRTADRFCLPDILPRNALPKPSAYATMGRHGGRPMTILHVTWREFVLALGPAGGRAEVKKRRRYQTSPISRPKSPDGGLRFGLICK